MGFFTFLRRWAGGAALCVRTTRPGFLVITAVACGVGMACASATGGTFSLPKAWATLALALLAHAAANVLNDHEDAINGADAANTQGLFPFTGGSRLIQDGIVQAQDMRRLALVLLAMVVPGGLWLTLHSGSGLLWIGIAGIFLGWAYSAPPLALMSRGLGELAVALAWAWVVIGADYVQRGHFVWLPAVAAVGYGLMIANILIANAFPDAASDAQVGKRTLVVRLTPRRAAWFYLALVLLAHGWLAVMVLLQVLPLAALLALVALPLGLLGAILLIQRANTPERLRPALVLGIAAAVLHGLGLAVGFWNS